MSNQANIELLESIFEEVQEAFPFYDEEKQIEIANNRFWEMAQWHTKLWNAQADTGSLTV